MLLDVVLHDTVILMGIDTNVFIMREAEVHDIAKDAMSIRVAGYTMYDVIGLYVVKPLAVVYLRVGWLWRRQKSEITHDMASILYDIATMLFHIADDECLRRVAISPLVHIS